MQSLLRARRHFEAANLVVVEYDTPKGRTTSKPLGMRAARTLYEQKAIAGKNPVSRKA